MNIVENKYHSTIKVEFRDLVDNILHSNRDNYHMYTIHRLLSLGLLIDFPFKYVKAKESDFIWIELDLKDSGKVLFAVNPDSDYGSIADEESKAILIHFLSTFDIGCDTKSKRRSLFEKQ
jgi:hypothetical protein